MRILHTISSLSGKSGGTSTCTYDLVRALNDAGCSTDLLTLKPKDQRNHLLGNDIFIRALDNDTLTPLGVSKTFRQALHSSEYDIYHTNGLWLDANHATCAIARKKGKPYIITPHGMLFPQALERSAWKKKLMLALGHDRDIADATCIHVTCKQELEYYRMLGYENPVVIIPNPVFIPDYISTVTRSNDCFRIGFMGRLHPIKHVDDLIKAWGEVEKRVDGGELLIIGEGDSSYAKQLHNLVKRLGLHNVRFTGFLKGKEKFDALASLSALFVPSEFENFGMVVPESLIVGTPVMASLGTPWEELNTYRCGWWMGNSVESLSECIHKIMQLPSKELKQMGERGKKYVCEHYSFSVVASQMKKLYLSITNN